MGSKKHISREQKEKTIELPTAERIAELFDRKGLTNTSKWIIFSINTKLPDPKKDLDDIVNSLRNEIRGYRREYYHDSRFRKSCFDIIWKTVLLGIATSEERFEGLTKELVPLMSKIIQTNKLLEDIVKATQNLDQEAKFYMICFYYLMLMEGSFKNVMKNLLAMKRLTEGKNVTVTETLGLVTEEEIEKEQNLKEILPERLKRGNHRNLRNSIAHANFRYNNNENKMEFWDIYPKTQQYSLEPIKLTYEEFSKSLVEVNLFCEIFGFINLVFMALEDVTKRYK